MGKGQIYFERLFDLTCIGSINICFENCSGFCFSFIVCFPSGQDVVFAT